ncbi:MAG: hypothetical protein ACQERS_10460 [Bacteroidota bacterium]
MDGITCRRKPRLTDLYKEISPYKRENLICDMEKTGKRLKLFRYYLKDN